MSLAVQALSRGGAEVTATAYNAAADRFDEPALGFWNRCGRRTIAHAAPPRGSRLLDVGCGTGASVLPAARAVGPKGSVLGVDLAEGLLGQARLKARAAGLKNVEFRVGDMTDLGLPDESFDTVVCVFAIFFVEDMVEQLRELWRLVRPGGRLAITTWGSGLFEPACTIFWSSIERYRPELVRRYSPWDRLVDPRALRELYRAGGAPKPKVRIERARQALRSADDWWTIACGTGYRWTIDQLSPIEAELVRLENARELEAAAVSSIGTDFICAVARKPTRPAPIPLYWDVF